MPRRPGTGACGVVHPHHGCRCFLVPGHAGPHRGNVSTVHAWSTVKPDFIADAEQRGRLVDVLTADDVGAVDASELIP